MAQIDRISGYVGELGMKPPCNCATTAPIILSGEQTVDGYACTATDNNNLGTRVLVMNQANGVGNGIYYCNTLAWVRSPDFDGPRDVAQGTRVLVTGGTTQYENVFQVMSPNPVDPSAQGSAITFENVAYILTGGSTVTSNIEFNIQGVNGAVITGGVKGYLDIPYDCTIVGWSAYSTLAGSISVDIQTSTYANFPAVGSITGGAPPNIAASTKGQLLGQPPGWSPNLAAGTVMAFVVTGNPVNVNNVTVSLQVTK